MDSPAPHASAADRPEDSLPYRDRIAGMADTCVKCGLCLPHCPTYRIAGLEGESPRGRIALIDGLARGALPAAGGTATHLDNCTGCLACESVCPAGVAFGRLLDEGRAELQRRGHGGGAAARWLGILARRPRLARLLLPLLRLARRLGAPRVAAALGLGPRTAPGRILGRLPADPAPRRGLRIPESDGARGRVMLFTGCVTPSLDRETLDDARSVLAACGHTVEIPASQGCCGALDLHGGRPDRAVRLASANCTAFGPGNSPVISLATGCAATLAEYDRLAPGAGAPFRDRVTDVIAFLASNWRDRPVALQPLGLSVAVFRPCSARNVATHVEMTAPLLRRIPEIRVHELGVGYGCCGAAGHHFITRGEQADRLVAPIVEEVRTLDPDCVAVTNVGCSLHIAGALRAAGLRAQVMHPVSILARSLAGGG